MAFRARDASYYGVNLNPHDLARGLNEGTGRPRSMPPAHHTLQRIPVGAPVTLEDPERPGGTLTAHVRHYDAVGERYTVAAGARRLPGLRAAQLRAEPPGERADHVELLSPKPPLRSAQALRDYTQWRDEFSQGRTGGRWQLPARTGGSSRALAMSP
mmetsp:Transcript_39910/g.113998  ORF Transcript_39910/g.113998 Transcript_39910/m.113998 type:complete len:157 (+) Transcript_39910:79-549(+)